MLKSYFANATAHMTKNAYFELCQALGNEPIDEEIPVEFSDLPTDVQYVMNIYSRLKDEWDTMNGVYLGKSYNGLLDILNILEVPVEDRRMVFELIGVIDTHRSKAIDDKKPKGNNKSPTDKAL